jgi:hypothetical protein
VNDADFVQRLPLAQYDRLLQRDPNECLPQFAGKQARYALVVVDLVNRRPVEILRIQYSLLSFDSEGRIDPVDGEKEAKLAFEVLPPLPIKRPPGQVIDVQRHLPKKRYDDEYKWTPSPEIEAAIVKAIFGPTI